MNRKSISVFFASLLCTTLGHEYLDAKQSLRHHHRSQLNGVHNSKNNGEQCDFVCPVPSVSPEVDNLIGFVSLIHIEKTEIFALLNSSVNAAIAFQIGEPIALAVDGKTGVAVSINIEKQTVVYYPSGSTENAWNASQTTALAYLQKLGSPTSIENWKNGQSFKLNKATKEVKNALASIVQHLSLELAIRLKINPEAVISLVSVLIRGLSESRDVVSLLLGRLQSSENIIYGGLTKLTNLVVGLKAIGAKLNGGVSSLINNSTNVSLLLGENSGLNTLIDLLYQLRNSVDLAKVLGDILKSPEAFLALAVHIDGGIYIGLAGITAVIHNVQLYAAKKISLEALIDVLIQVEAENNVLKITKEIWKSYLDWYFVVAEHQSSQYDSASSWTNMNKFFNDLKQDKLVIDGINVSAMINILISTSGNASLGDLLKIVLHLKPAVSLSKLFATLYFRLICFVVSGQGLLFVHQLLPDISITISFSSTTSIIKQILTKVNYFEVGSYLIKLDIVGAITHLPVLGPILKALENSIKAVGVATEVTVSSALKATGSIINDLKNLILFGLGHGGNKGPADSGIAGISALGGGCDVSTTTVWVSSVEWTSSQKVSSGGHKESNGFSWTLF